MLCAVKQKLLKQDMLKQKKSSEDSNNLKPLHNSFFLFVCFFRVSLLNKTHLNEAVQQNMNHLLDAAKYQSMF